MHAAGAAPRLATLGIIAIGRNEGDRLRQCLESLEPLVSAGARVVYVDSNSSDGSQELAESRGATLLRLDLSKPFSAARARNEGLHRLLEMEPGTEFVFFLDGDCSLHRDFVPVALRVLQARPELAAVCGRRRERHPEASLYNRLIDLEWDTPVGDTLSVGGDALFRRSALEQVGGFDPTVSAAEEPELCSRLRAKGWRLARIDAEMTTHDAAISRFSQWWKRQVRNGYGIYDVATRFPEQDLPSQRRQVKNTRRWGLHYPVALIVIPLVLGFFSKGLAAAAAVVLLAVVPFQLARMTAAILPKTRSTSLALAHAGLTLLSAFPTLQGQVRYRKDRRMGAQRLIEYKAPTSVGP